MTLLRQVLSEIATGTDILVASTAARELGRPDIHAYLQGAFKRGMRRPAVAKVREEAIRLLTTEFSQQ